MKRLLEVRKQLGYTQKVMAEILQIGQNTYSMIENGRIGLTPRNRGVLIEKLQVNPQWLDGTSDVVFCADAAASTGSGTAMGAESGLATTHPSSAGGTMSEVGVPYYSKPVTGSIVMSFDDLAGQEPEYRINYAPFNDCSFYRPVWGESMSPRFNPGDVIACKRVINKNYILYGETYLCIISLDGDFYETIKILRRHANPGMIILKPANTEFDETEIPINAILELYLIKGKVERNL